MRHRKAFSLVELSIVLVILGLLVGGILAGQSLIKAAALRGVSTEASRHRTAIYAFRDKYFALPGDMANATNFWGAADGSTGNTAACRTAITNDARTCNGDASATLSSLTYSYENYRFWQHLANAGLIEGQYTGVQGTTPFENKAGSNVPGSRLSSGSTWNVRSAASSTGSNYFFDGELGVYLQLAVWNGAGATWTGNLSPADLWNVDKKLDDGMPGTGRITAPWGTIYSASTLPCTNAASSADLAADYNLANPNTDCILYLRKL